MSKPQLVEELMEVFRDKGYMEEEVEVIVGILCEYLGGRQVYIPRSWRGDEAFYRERDAQLAKRVEAGAKMCELAAEYGMSESALYAACKRDKVRKATEARERRQAELF